MYTELGAFTLPPDFNFEMELTNPLFSDEGSSSLPFTLPLTKENLVATDHPDVLAREERVIDRMECIVQYGTFQLQGLLSVSSLSKSELSGHIMLSESRMYSESRNSNIRDIIDHERVSTQSTVQGLCRILENNNEAYISKPEDDDYMPEEIAVFPVAGQFTDTYKLMLNGRVDESDEGGIAYGGLESAARSIKVGNDTYNVPEGYGLTAFPFLSHIINLILRNLGYKVIRNDFQTQPFCNLVLLNPVADAICAGTLYYKDLVPNITFGDFVEWLYDKFGAVICITGKSSASVVLLAKVLQMPFDIDLTEYAEDDETLSIPEVECVHISVDTSLEGAEPVDGEYDHAVHSVGQFNTVNKEGQASPAEGKYYYAKNTGKFYRKSKDGATIAKTEAFSFSGGNWTDKKEELSPSDLYTPMLSYSLYKPSYAVPYVGPFAHYHTVIKDSDEEEENSHPLMVCWVYYMNGYRCGTVCGHDAAGNRLTYGPDKTPLPALSPTGIYELCWAKYNAMLQDSAPEIAVKINLPLSILQTLDIVCPKRYKGHKVLIKSLSYSVSSTGVTYGEAKLQLIHEYVYPSSKTPYFPY